MPDRDRPGTRLGAAEPEVADTFYACLLVHIGCTAFSHETAAVFGDELQNTRAVARTNFADPTEVLTSFVPEATRGMSARSRVRVATFIVVKGSAFGRRYETASCEVARATARRIALPDGVQRSVYEVHEWWNGKGAPRGLRGEQIALPARLARVATEAARFCDIGVSRSRSTRFVAAPAGSSTRRSWTCSSRTARRS